MSRNTKNLNENLNSLFQLFSRYYYSETTYITSQQSDFEGKCIHFLTTGVIMGWHKYSQQFLKMHLSEIFKLVINERKILQPLSH